MSIRTTRVSPSKPPSSGTVVVATGKRDIEAKIPEGTSSDAAAALVGRYNAKKKRRGGKGCCPGKRGY
jgi:hypothetical protein